MFRLSAAACLAASLCVISASPAHAVAVDFLDFNDQTPGQTVTTQYANAGVKFSLLGTALPAGPTIFEVPVPANAFNLTGGNLVPGSKTFGVPQFDVLMSFTQRVDFLSIYAMDAEESFVLRAYLNGVLVATGTNAVVGSLGLPVVGPVVLASIGSIGGGIEFDQVVIDLTNGDGSDTGGPENYDNLTYHRVPEPRTLAVFGAVLLILAVLRMRLQR